MYLTHDTPDLAPERGNSLMLGRSPDEIEALFAADPEGALRIASAILAQHGMAEAFIATALPDGTVDTALDRDIANLAAASRRDPLLMQQAVRFNMKRFVQRMKYFFTNWRFVTTHTLPFVPMPVFNLTCDPGLPATPSAKVTYAASQSGTATGSIKLTAAGATGGYSRKQTVTVALPGQTITGDHQINLTAEVRVDEYRHLSSRAVQPVAWVHTVHSSVTSAAPGQRNYTAITPPLKPDGLINSPQTRSLVKSTEVSAEITLDLFGLPATLAGIAPTFGYKYESATEIVAELDPGKAGLIRIEVGTRNPMFFRLAP